VNDVIKETIIRVAVKETLAALVTRLPFLSFGPFGLVIGYVLEKLFSFALDKTILGVNLYLIDIKTDTEVANLKELLNEASTLDHTEKDKLDSVEQKIIDNARNLIQLYDSKRMQQ
jgi:hypothetical protein